MAYVHDNPNPTREMDNALSTECPGPDCDCPSCMHDRGQAISEMDEAVRKAKDAGLWRHPPEEEVEVFTKVPAYPDTFAISGRPIVMPNGAVKYCGVDDYARGNPRREWNSAECRYRYFATWSLWRHPPEVKS